MKTNLLTLFLLIPFLSYSQLSSPIRTDEGNASFDGTATNALSLGGILASVWSTTTNFFNTRLTSGSPDNGSVLTATNTLGETKWSEFVAFRAKMAVDLALVSTTVSNLFFGTEVYDYGNNFDGTYFVCPVNGLYAFVGKGPWKRTSGLNIVVQMYLYADGALIYFDDGVWGSGPSEGTCTAITYIVLDAGDIVYLRAAGTVGGADNYFRSGYTSFEGALLRELE